jgi:hypothetical protein
MGFLDDVLASDATLAFIDPDLTPGCESITVGTDGGTERTINAVVTRGVPVVADGKMRRPNPSISVANHPTLGIDVTTYNAGRTYVKFARDKGGTVETYRLHGKPTSQDAGMLTFEI